LQKVDELINACEDPEAAGEAFVRVFLAFSEGKQTALSYKVWRSGRHLLQVLHKSSSLTLRSSAFDSAPTGEVFHVEGAKCGTTLKLVVGWIVIDETNEFRIV
jgi:hypothetical protein